MRRLQYLALFALIILTACGTGPKKDAILNTLPTPFPTAELLIAPPEMATPTKWLSPLSATTKALIEERERWTPTPYMTPTTGYHMPTNIYSPTPKPTNKPCYVKGNPNSMIYHCPGSPNYSDLTGYRCFSSSAEAEEAGYRPAKNMGWCGY